MIYKEVAPKERGKWLQSLITMRVKQIHHVTIKVNCSIITFFGGVMCDVRRQQHKQQCPICCSTRFPQPPAKPPDTWPPTLPNSGESQLVFHQQGRYVGAFDYFIKMQYDDSPVLINEKVTHGCVAKICIDIDVFLQTVDVKGYGQNGDFEFVF
jgi:hypothetical protein